MLKLSGNRLKYVGIALSALLVGVIGAYVWKINQPSVSDRFNAQIDGISAADYRRLTQMSRDISQSGRAMTPGEFDYVRGLLSRMTPTGRGGHLFMLAYDQARL